MFCGYRRKEMETASSVQILSGKLGFHFALMPLKKVQILLFSHRLWVKCKCILGKSNRSMSMTDPDGRSTHLWLFHANKLGNRVHYTFTLLFLLTCFLSVFFPFANLKIHMYIYIYICVCVCEAWVLIILGVLSTSLMPLP